MKKWILWGSGLILFILVLGWGMLSSHRVQDWRVNRMMRQAGNKRQARLTKDVVEDHTTPVQAAKLANQAGVQLLVYTHVVPPPDNFLLRRLFLRGVSSVRSRGVPS